jgi:UTP--glucose-1-phosphate uridylyltransferase
LTAVDGLGASVEKMRREGLPDAAIDTFEHYYRQLAEGETGMLPESDIEPLDELQDLDTLADEEGPLDQAVVLKLNGGLGTSMGMPRTGRRSSTSSRARCSTCGSVPGRGCRSCS